MITVIGIKVDSEMKKLRKIDPELKKEMKTNLWTKLINLSEGLRQATSVIRLRSPIKSPVNSKSNLLTFSENVSDGSKDVSFCKLIVLSFKNENQWKVK